MNRHGRRTQGKAILQRLNILKNSPLIQEADLKDVPKDVLDHLIAGDYENKVMQKKYNTMKRILGEIMEHEIALNNMKADLLVKQSLIKKYPLRPQDALPSLPT